VGEGGARLPDRKRQRCCRRAKKFPGHFPRPAFSVLVPGNLLGKSDSDHNLHSPFARPSMTLVSSASLRVDMDSHSLILGI
jgi:hypothetical protein